MAENTGIEWADSTFNAWSGCTKVSPACAKCYAERWAKRMGRGWGPDAPRVSTAPDYWKQLDKWNTAEMKLHAANPKQPYRIVFVNSLSDYFDEWPGQIEDHKGNRLWINPDKPLDHPHTTARLGYPTGPGKDDVPYTLDFARARMLDRMENSPYLIFLILTKRPQFAADMLLKADSIIAGCTNTDARPALIGDMQALLPNVWVGVTCESPAYTERIVEIRKLGASVTFVSHEPAIEALDFGAIGSDGYPIGQGVGWWITGGESGDGARPLHPDVPRLMESQCRRLDVPFFFKQWGEWMPFDSRDLRTMKDVGNRTPVALLKNDGRVIRPYCGEDGPGQEVAKVGVQRAGDKLDGRRHHKWPKLARKG